MRLLPTVARSVQPSRKPQPCGFWNDPTRECRCTPLQIQRYVGRISGPLLDRIDIHIDVPAVKFRELTGDTAPETDSSNTIRERVIQARERQQQRLAEERIFSNAVMTPRMIRRYCQCRLLTSQSHERFPIFVCFVCCARVSGHEQVCHWGFLFCALSLRCGSGGRTSVRA